MLSSKLGLLCPFREAPPLLMRLRYLATFMAKSTVCLRARGGPSVVSEKAERGRPR